MNGFLNGICTDPNGCNFIDGYALKNDSLHIYVSFVFNSFEKKDFYSTKVIFQFRCEPKCIAYINSKYCLCNNGYVFNSKIKIGIPKCKRKKEKKL